MCKEYNGYSNYETWNASLWIDNDEGSQSLAIELAEQAESIRDLSEQLEQTFLEDFAPECVKQVVESASMFADLLQHAFGKINWYEIAENFWEEYHTDDESENDETEE